MLNILSSIADFVSAIVFYEIFGFPILVLWLLSAGLFLSFKLKFPNIKLMKHGVLTAFKNQYYSNKDIGIITPRQALFTSISGTVGMGNIAGVAIAIKLGGPGAVIWMMIIAFFAMNTVFAEAILSQKYREVDNNGKITGGPFAYLKNGLSELGYNKLGLWLSVIYAFILIFSAFGTTVFQVNQAVSNISSYKIFNGCELIFGAIFALFGIYILFSGAKTIGKIIDKIVPLMAILYLICAIIIVSIHYKNIPSSFLLMIQDAFGIKKVVAGFLGALIMGVKRAGYSNEAGLGTTSISHALAKTSEPVREGAVACITPMIDTMFFCCLTALMIISTNSYTLDLDGVLMTKEAFLTVSSWFPILLSCSVVLFVLSNMMAYSFYGQSAFNSITKNRFTIIYNILFGIVIFTSSIADINTIVKIADAFVLSLSIPNLIGVFMMSNIIKNEIELYIYKLHNNKFKNT